ncbi:PAS domain-containing sensor histidine kinase [Methanohalophilus halophilus]|nr:PAS domain-containing sensor histidine kinase [Methanohalophilus halophilus]
MEKDILIKENAVEKAINPIGFINMDYKFIDVNNAFLNLWGYDNKVDVSGKTIFDFFRREKRTREIVQTLISEGRWEGEVVCVKKDGTEFPSLLSANLLLDKDGKPLGIMGSAMDVTKYKEAENAIIEGKIAAENANKAKTEFLRNASHELRTPLNSIIGFSSILIDKRDSEPLTKNQLKYIKIVLKNGDHLLKVFNDILSIADIDLRKTEIYARPFNILEAIKNIEEGLRPFADSKKIKLTFDVDPNLEIINGDKEKLKQTLYNLTENAITFTPQNGFVSLTARKINGYIEISIKDTGIGISQEDKSRLFLPFVQLDGSTTRKYDGLGLGLTIAQNFIEAHNGDIWVESEIDKGSTFTCKIPTNLQIPEN